FGYPRFASLGHMQLQFTVLQPLILWAVIASVRGAASRPRLEIAALLVAVSVMWVLVFATVYYFGWLLALFALTGAAVGLTIPAVRHAGIVLARRHWVGFAVAAGVAAVLLLPVARIYVPVARQTGGRPWSEVLAFIPEPWMLGWLGVENVVWGRFFARFPPALVDRARAEGRIGIGIVATRTVAVAIAGAYRGV